MIMGNLTYVQISPSGKRHKILEKFEGISKCHWVFCIQFITLRIIEISSLVDILEIMNCATNETVTTFLRIVRNPLKRR